MHRWPSPLAVVLLLAATAPAHAQVSLNSVRIVPKDAETQTPQGPAGDEVMHVIFTVVDAAATAAAAKIAGGTVTREPSQYGSSGIFIAFVTDPEGNRIELIRPARR